MSRHLSRRTMLRGIGESIALPWLEAMGPTILAGGRNLGLRHGRFFKPPGNEGDQQGRNERPLGDLFVTVVHRFDIPARSFADNAGEFSEILQS